MATYVPNATDFTEPLESQTVESAALEFRTLKARVNALDAAVAADDLTDLRVPETSIAVLPAIASRAGKVLGFDAGGDPAMVDVAGATDPSLRSDLAASSGASLVGYLPAGTGAVPTTVQAKLRESVSVKDFGAIGDGITDDTAAIQASLDSLGGLGRLVFPSGVYKLTDTLLVTYTSTLLGVEIEGAGIATKLAYSGATNKPIIKVIGTAGAGHYANTAIRNLYLRSDLAVGSGVVGIAIGEPLDIPLGGVGNVTITGNTIIGMAYGIQLAYESDEIYITNNHLFGYSEVGIDNQGNSGIRITNNHLQDGGDDSYFVKSNKANVTISDNVLQTANTTRGIQLSNAGGFRVVNNYSEALKVGVNNRFFDAVNSTNGYVANNQLGGFPSGAALYNVDATSSGITFGHSGHLQSGGTPTKILNIAAGAAGIIVLGDQVTSSVASAISGTPQLKVNSSTLTYTGAGIVSSGYVSALNFISRNGTAVLNQYVAVTLFTMVAGEVYLVSIGDVSSLSAVTALVTVPPGAAAAVATNIYATNTTKLNITVSGLDVRALRNIAGNSSGLWTAVRIK